MREIERRTIRVMPTKEEIEEFLKLKLEDRPYVEIVQDESICYAFDDESRAWVLKDDMSTTQTQIQGSRDHD